MKLKFFLIGSIAVLAAAGTAFKLGWFSKNSLRQTYKTFTVKRSDLQRIIVTTALVSPYNRLEIKPPISGRADQVLVSEGDSVKRGQILAWMSSTERAVLLDAARAKGAQTLSYWETLYKPTPLLAPIDGVIIAKNVQSGQTVTQQDALLVMSDELIVKAQVDETDLAEIKKGGRAELILDAYPKQKIEATVDHIAYEAKTVNNVTVYEVDLVPKHIPQTMRSGMSATVYFKVDERSQVLVIPNEALIREGQGVSVLKENLQFPENPTAQPVEVGLTDGKQSEILSGVLEGEKILMRSKEKNSSRQAPQTNPLQPAPAGRGRR